MDASMEARSPEEVIARYAHDATRRAIQHDLRGLAGLFLEPYENLTDEEREAVTAIYKELLDADVIHVGGAVAQSVLEDDEPAG